VLLGLIVQVTRKIRQKARQAVKVVVNNPVTAYAPFSTQNQVTTLPVSTQNLAPTWTSVSPQLPSSPPRPASHYTPPAPTPPPAGQYNPPAPTTHPFDYYSAPVTTPAPPIQQPHDGATTEEVNRLRQERDALMAAVYEHQRHQQNAQVHGEDGGYLPPPEYEPTTPSQSSGTWQAPRSPPPEKSRNEKSRN
jgi:hypothetical protein